jgi:hypothetical protein
MFPTVINNCIKFGYLNVNNIISHFNMNILFITKCHNLGSRYLKKSLSIRLIRL